MFAVIRRIEGILKGGLRIGVSLVAPDVTGRTTGIMAATNFWVRRSVGRNVVDRMEDRPDRCLGRTAQADELQGG